MPYRGAVSEPSDGMVPCWSLRHRKAQRRPSSTWRPLQVWVAGNVCCGLGLCRSALQSNSQKQLRPPLHEAGCGSSLAKSSRLWKSGNQEELCVQSRQNLRQAELIFPTWEIHPVPELRLLLWEGGRLWVYFLASQPKPSLFPCLGLWGSDLSPWWEGCHLVTLEAHRCPPLCSNWGLILSYYCLSTYPALMNVHPSSGIGCRTQNVYSHQEWFLVDESTNIHWTLCLLPARHLECSFWMFPRWKQRFLFNWMD